MILSKLALDRRDQSVRRDLRDCQSMHRSVMRLFGEERRQAGVLYRVRATEQAAAIYLLSEKPPQAEPAAGMRLIGSTAVDDDIASFEGGQSYDFDLLASPCRKVGADGVKNSRRRTLRTPQERAAWLDAKGQAAGFRVLWVRESGQQELWGRHSSGEGGEMRMTAIHFCGTLTVENAELFGKAYCGGIGPGKAYGLGMLLLHRTAGD